MPGTRFSPVAPCSLAGRRARGGPRASPVPCASRSPDAAAQLEVADADAAHPARRRPSRLGVHQVRDPQEVRHLCRPRLLVDLLRRPDLLDPAVRHHGQPVGHREGLLLVVGHVDERDARPSPAGPSARPAAPCGASRRARPSGSSSRSTAGFEHQRAGQRHPLLLATRELGGPPVLHAAPSAPVRAPRRDLRADVPLRNVAGTAARTRRCRTRSGAGTGRSSGRRCSRCACAAGSAPCRRRPGGSRPRSAARTRRSAGAWSSCRIPTARGARRTRPAPCPGRSRHRDDVVEPFDQVDEPDLAAGHGAQDSAPYPRSARQLEAGAAPTRPG